MRAQHSHEEPRSYGVRARTTHLKECNGVTAEATEWHCEGSSVFELTCARYRVGFVLEQIGGRCETRIKRRVSQGYVHRGRPFVNLTPPGMPVWACSDDIRYARSVSLAFSPTALQDWLGDDVHQHELTPQLNFEHGRLSELAPMLASECRDPGPFGDLYVDGLVIAMLVEVARLGGQANGRAHAFTLAPWQLRLATEFMEAKVGSRVLLNELAQLTGLSQSHFSRAFKASTGVPPYQWYLQSRIRRAQQLLLDESLSIAEVAAATGFVDQAHFTRVFSRVTHATPGMWKRDRCR